MINKLEQIKAEIIHSNIEIIIDEVDTFISTYVKNVEKKKNLTKKN